jgi:hypothetical protein
MVDDDIQNGTYAEATALQELQVGGTINDHLAMEKYPNPTITSPSNSETEASSIIKLNNGDVLYMREINR